MQTELCARGARGCEAQGPPWVPPPCTSWDPHLELGVPPGWDQVRGAPTGPQPSGGDGDGDGLCFIPGARGLQGGGRRPPPAGRRSAGRKRGRYRAAGCSPGSAAASGPKFPGVTITAVPSWALPSPPSGQQMRLPAAPPGWG